MVITAFVNEKGGSGKSSLSIMVAVALHRAGKRVVLVDADPQGTTRDWREASPEGVDLPDVIALDRPEMVKSIRNINADFVIVDTPAKAEKMTASVIGIAHNALIVIQPSAADIWASAAAVKLIVQKRDLGGSINAAFLANRVNGATKLAQEIIKGDWNEYEGIDQLNSTVSNKVSFANALSNGVSIYETSDTGAQMQIENIIEELEGRGWF